MKKTAGICLLLTIIIFFEILLNSCLICKGEAATAEELAILLLETEDKSKRIEILEQNRDLLTRKFVEDFIKDYYDNRRKLPPEEVEKRENLAQEIADSSGDDYLRGLVLYHKANRIDIKDKETFESSLAYFYSGIECFQKTDYLPGVAWCYTRIGFNTEYFEKDIEKSLENYEKALTIFRELGLKANEAMCLTYMGSACGDSDDSKYVPKGLEYFNNALDIYREIDSRVGESEIYEALGWYYDDQENYEESLLYFGEQLQILFDMDCDILKYDSSSVTDIFSRAGKREIDLNALRAFRCEQMGTLLLYRNPLEAMKYYKKSLEFLDRVKGDKSVSKEWIYSSMGFAYLYFIGKKEEGMRYYKKFLEIVEQGKPGNLRMANVYLQVGGAFQECGYTEEAVMYFNKGLDYLKEEKDSDDINRAGACLLYNLARLYFEIEEIDRAKEFLMKSVEKCDTLKGLSFRLMADIYLSENNSEKALYYYRAGKEFETEGGDDFNFLGKVYFQMKDYERAGKYNQMAMNELKEEDINTQTPGLYLEIGELFEKLDREKEAIEAYKCSVNVLENNLNLLVLDEYKMLYMDKYTVAYDKIINLLLKEGHTEEAFNYCERARARVLLDSLANNKVDLHQCEDRELIKEIDELERKIKICSDKEDRDEEKIEELKWKYEEKLEELKLKKPEYASLRTVSPPSLEEIQSFLDKDTALLEYFSLEEELILWIITEDDIFTGTIPVSRKDLKEKVIFYREQIATGMTAEKLQSDEWKNTAGGFYNLLMREWENLIEDKKRLIIVPHRSLHYLPFHTFLNSEGKFLIEKYEITYLPSAGTLGYCREKNTDKKENLVAFEYGNLERPPYSPLPWSITEVDAIRKIYPQNEVYKAEEITEDTIKSSCERADLIHFATHGILDGEAPMLSKLVLSEDDLEVYEIFDLDLSACLVTLSACRTGLGEFSEGDDLVGFSRAFIYAGTPTVCVSLWDVSDRATAELMERFYFHLRDKEKGEALRLAMLEIKEKYPHPFFWAPFVIMGDWR